MELPIAVLLDGSPSTVQKSAGRAHMVSTHRTFKAVTIASQAAILSNMEQLNARHVQMAITLTTDILTANDARLECTELMANVLAALRGHTVNTGWIRNPVSCVQRINFQAVGNLAVRIAGVQIVVVLELAIMKVWQNKKINSQLYS